MLENCWDFSSVIISFPRCYGISRKTGSWVELEMAYSLCDISVCRPRESCHSLACSSKAVKVGKFYPTVQELKIKTKKKILEIE